MNRREAPIPSLYASIRESFPGEIEQINRVLWHGYQDQKALHARLLYADHVFTNRPRPAGFVADAVDFALWRGLLVKQDGSLHAGSTAADAELYSRMLNAGASAISQPVDDDHEGISVPLEDWPEDEPQKVERDARELFSQALVSVPAGSRGEACISYRTTPAFFTVEHSPARVDVADLDSGVALLVKTLPLVGVWSWCSCDGHHLLGPTPRKSVKPATVDLAEIWDALWFAGLLKLARRAVDLQCNWQISGSNNRCHRLTVAAPRSPASKGSDDLFQRAFVQDRDMQVLARWFLRDEVNEVVRAIKRRCWKTRPADRLRAFHHALVELETAGI